jgi:fucose permease
MKASQLETKQSLDGSAAESTKEVSSTTPSVSREINESPMKASLDKDISVEPEIDPLVEKDNQPKSLRFKMTVFFLCVVTLVAAMDAVIVGACLAAIAEDLNSSSVESFWVGTSFLLGQTVTIPIYGTTSEIFGRKWPILIALSIFIFGSILCATAQTVGWLIGARVVQGIGAGGMIQLVQVILSDISTMSERGLYMALAALAWSLGTNIGYFARLSYIHLPSQFRAKLNLLTSEQNSNRRRHRVLHDLALDLLDECMS